MKYLLREATAEEIENWDQLILANPNGGDILQGSTFASIKKNGHWRPRYVIYDGLPKIAALFLERTVPTIGKIIYCPAGPGVATVEQLAAVVKANQTFCNRRQNIFLIKMDPALPAPTNMPSQLTKAPSNIQPHAAVACIINFPDTPEDLFAFYSSHERNRIRKAEKSGITVRLVESNEINLKKFFDLYTSTGERNSFFVRPYSYYRKFWQAFSNAKQGQLFFAEKNGQLLCGGFVIHFGRLGYYKDSGSVRGVPLLNAPHLLQWEMQRWLLQQGVRRYEMIGVPPLSRLNDETHPLYNVGMFKRSFDPNIIDLVGTWDQILRPAAHKRWLTYGQKISNKVARHIWKDNLY